MTDAKALGAVVRELERTGLLLQSDRCLPNLATMVAGQTIIGSWWGHSRAREIYGVLNAFIDRDDVLVTRLVSGKVTFVHRSLWADLLVIATSGEGWQTDRLSADARRLLLFVERKGTVRTGADMEAHGLKGNIGDTVRELERRLLLQSEEIHTAKGAHAKTLTTWSKWAAARKMGRKDGDTSNAKSKFETIVRSLNLSFGGDGRLPWIVEEAR